MMSSPPEMKSNVLPTTGATDLIASSTAAEPATAPHTEDVKATPQEADDDAEDKSCELSPLRSPEGPSKSFTPLSRTHESIPPLAEEACAPMGNLSVRDGLAVKQEKSDESHLSAEFAFPEAAPQTGHGALAPSVASVVNEEKAKANDRDALWMNSITFADDVRASITAHGPTIAMYGLFTALGFYLSCFRPSSFKVWGVGFLICLLIWSFCPLQFVPGEYINGPDQDANTDLIQNKEKKSTTNAN